MLTPPRGVVLEKLLRASNEEIELSPRTNPSNRMLTMLAIVGQFSCPPSSNQGIMWQLKSIEGSSAIRIRSKGVRVQCVTFYSNALGAKG